jgi:hypothetical protein
MNQETEMLITKKLEKIKNRKKMNEKAKNNKSKNSIYDLDNNCSPRFKDLRNRKRFQTEFNKNFHLLNDEKNKIGKFYDSNKKLKKSPSKKSNFFKNAFKSNIKDSRKMSIEIGNELYKNNNNSLNESSFLDNDNYIKQKELIIDNSLSNKKSSELSDNSSILILLKSPKRSKITLINNETSKNDKDKKIIDKKETKMKKANKKRNVPIPINNRRKLDKYIFNKVYIKKLEHLEKLTNKEYKFQKGILRNKSFEQLPKIKFEPDKDKKDAEFFFIKALDEKLKLLEEKVQNLGENDKKDNYLEKKIKRQLLSYKTKACISLNYKDKEKYCKIIRDISNKEKEKEKKINKNLINLRNNTEIFDIKKINENNNIQMNILGGKIEKIERKISNSLNKNKNKNKKNNSFDKQNLKVVPRNKSTKEIKRNRNLISRLLGKRMSLKIDRDSIDNNRKSINMKTNVFDKTKIFSINK